MAQYFADRRTLGELLSLTAPVWRITVPDWQRSYSWDTDQVKTFWEDLLHFNEAYPGSHARGHEYFLGSIVLVEKTNNNEYELLDGQQRLATVTILLSVIRKYLAKHKADAATGLERDFIVKENYATSERTYKLRMGKYDADFFQRAVQDYHDNDDQLPIPELRSHKFIRKAYQYFDARFSEEYAKRNGGRPSYDWALGIQRTLTDHLSVVEVKSYDEDNAAEVFETLNYRGIVLSTTDLLRNLILRRSRDSEREEINDAWENIFQLEDHVEEFLRHWWLSRHGDLTGRGLYKAFKPKVIGGQLVPIDLTRQLDVSATIYQAFLECRDDDLEIAGLLRDVKDLGAKLLYPVLLSTYSTGYEIQRKRMLFSLLTLFVRYNVISGLEGTRLEPQIYRLASELRENGEIPYVERIREFAPDDERFKMAFEDVQIPRQATARYLLREIENARRPSSELRIQGSSRVHLEHIYPQKPRLGQQREDHESVLNRLGNLTLLSARLNQEAKNAPFVEKKQKYAESQLLITRDLTRYEDWDLDSINDRQAKFAEQSLSIWAFPE